MQSWTLQWFLKLVSVIDILSLHHIPLAKEERKSHMVKPIINGEKQSGQEHIASQAVMGE